MCKKMFFRFEAALLLALIFLSIVVIAWAHRASAQVPTYTDAGGTTRPASGVFVIGQTSVGNLGSLTRPNTTPTYGANVLVCGTTCAPIAVQLTTVPGATGMLGRVLLLKSGSSLTNANFNLWVFRSYPTMTGLSDGSTYVGPFAADISSGNYLGELSCSSFQNTNDASAQSFSECSPVGQNWLQYQAAPGAKYVNVLISTGVASYAPAASEVFTPVANALKDQ